MYGAILGDMIGAPYEFDRGDKTKDFPLLSADSQFTDDTVMTIAVAEALLDTMPEAVTAFLEGTDFEDVIRTAVSLGGDCDTLTCIAGSIAEAFYGVPDALITACRGRLPQNIIRVVDRFRQHFTEAKNAEVVDNNRSTMV